MSDYQALETLTARERELVWQKLFRTWAERAGTDQELATVDRSYNAARLDNGKVSVSRLPDGYKVTLELEPWVKVPWDREAEMLRREGIYIGPYEDLNEPQQARKKR